MKIKQVYSFINSAISQLQGFEDISVQNAADLVSLGELVLSSDKNNENFWGTVCDVLGKDVISNRAHTPRDKSLLMDGFTFGAVLRKLYVAPIDAQEAAHWDVTDGDKTDIHIVKPTVKQKLFSGITTWELDTAIPDKQADSAFHNPSELAALISAIYTELDSSMAQAIETMINTVYATAIANRLIYQTNPELVSRTIDRTLVVDLRVAYNTFYGLTSTDAGYLGTAGDCNRSAAFLRFAGQTIRDYAKYFRERSTMFSMPDVVYDAIEEDYVESPYVRETPKSLLRLSVIADWASSFNTNLQSDVLHNELTALPGYTEVAYWQGFGEAFSGTRKIAIKADTLYTDDGSKKTYKVEQDGVIAILWDAESMGVTIDNQRLKSVYDTRHEVTALYNKADKGFYVDPSENCVVFVVAGKVEGAVDTSLNTPTEVV